MNTPRKSSPGIFANERPAGDLAMGKTTSARARGAGDAVFEAIATPPAFSPRFAADAAQTTWLEDRGRNKALRRLTARSPSC